MVRSGSEIGPSQGGVVICGQSQCRRTRGAHRYLRREPAFALILPERRRLAAERQCRGRRLLLDGARAQAHVAALAGVGVPESPTWDKSYVRIRMGWERLLARIKVTLGKSARSPKNESSPKDPRSRPRLLTAQWYRKRSRISDTRSIVHSACGPGDHRVNASRSTRRPLDSLPACLWASSIHRSANRHIAHTPMTYVTLGLFLLVINAA